MRLNDGSYVPREPDALISAGIQALESGDATRAVELLREAARLAPFRKDARDVLALALQQTMANTHAAEMAAPPQSREPRDSAQANAAAPSPSQTEAPPRRSIGGGFSSFAKDEGHFQKQVEPFVRSNTLAPKLWFILLTVVICAIVAAYVITQVNVGQIIEDIHTTPEERQAKEEIERIDRLIQDGQFDAALTKAAETAPAAGDLENEIQKKKVAALQGMAAGLMAESKYEESIPLLEEAMGLLEPARLTDTDTETDMFFLMGQAYFKWAEVLRINGKLKTNEKVELYGKAAEYLQKTILRDDKNLQAYVMLGHAHIIMGNILEASEYWNRVIEIKPDSIWAEEAMENLKKHQLAL